LIVRVDALHFLLVEQTGNISRSKQVALVIRHFAAKPSEGVKTGGQGLAELLGWDTHKRRRFIGDASSILLALGIGKKGAESYITGKGATFGVVDTAAFGWDYDLTIGLMIGDAKILIAMDELDADEPIDD
jgi:hypothetical protein